MEGHICRQNTLMFALVFCFELRARAARTCCHCHLAVKNPIHDGKRGQLKLPKKSWTVPQCGHVTLIVYKWRRSNQMLSFHRTFFHLLDFTVSLSCRDWHSETPWSHSSNQLVVRTVRHRISCCAPTIHWKCDAQIPNRQIKSPPALVIAVSGNALVFKGVRPSVNPVAKTKFETIWWQPLWLWIHWSCGIFHFKMNGVILLNRSTKVNVHHPNETLHPNLHEYHPSFLMPH